MSDDPAFRIECYGNDGEEEINLLDYLTNDLTVRIYTQLPNGMARQAVHVVCRVLPDGKLEVKVEDFGVKSDHGAER